jgi:hypothetical protein
MWPGYCQQYGEGFLNHVCFSEIRKNGPLVFHRLMDGSGQEFWVEDTAGVKISASAGKPGIHRAGKDWEMG